MDMQCFRTVIATDDSLGGHRLRFCSKVPKHVISQCKTPASMNKLGLILMTKFRDLTCHCEDEHRKGDRLNHISLVFTSA